MSVHFFGMIREPGLYVPSSRSLFPPAEILREYAAARIGRIIRSIMDRSAYDPKKAPQWRFESREAAVASSDLSKVRWTYSGIPEAC